MSPTRRQSRERALALLYEAACKEVSLAEILDSQLVPAPELAAALLTGIEANLSDIDASLRRHLQNWSLERLSQVDLALLRLGVYELGYCEDVPVAVAIDEAVELAKQYSTADSSRFINGVLAGVLAEGQGGDGSAAGVAPAGFMGDTALGTATADGILAGTAGQLVLQDGTSFSGRLFGAELPDGFVAGEVVFNTSLVGYQEIITDPSYAGQIITFTYPHIGNYGITPDDDESPMSAKPACRGIIVRQLTLRPSNWRATASLPEQLAAQGLTVISDIDTRRLTRHIRDRGAMPGAFGSLTQDELAAAAQAEPGTDGVDLVAQVSCAEPYLAASVVESGADSSKPWHVVAYDLGIKRTILRQLASFAEVEVVPAATPYAEVLECKPDGVFLSNGPGDPRMAPAVAANVKGLLGELPVFGICLGHQILALALGAEIVKLPFGHHGGNHPVQNLVTGEVEITAQNHNFVVAAPKGKAIFEVTHLNLNDQTVEGLKAKDLPAMGIQYHPEAGPGPHDSRYLFGEFRQLLEEFHQTGGSSGSGSSSSSASAS